MLLTADLVGDEAVAVSSQLVRSMALRLSVIRLPLQRLQLVFPQRRCSLFQGDVTCFDIVETSLD
jgi:hypothetical protein